MLSHLIICPNLMGCLLNSSISPWANPCPCCYDLHPSHQYLPPDAARCQASIWSSLTHTPHCTLTNRLKRQSDLACLLPRIFTVSPTASRGKPASVAWLTSFCLSLQPHFPDCLLQPFSRAGTQRLLLPICGRIALSPSQWTNAH